MIKIIFFCTLFISLGSQAVVIDYSPELTAKALSDSSIELSWFDENTEVIGSSLYERQSDGQYKLLQWLTPVKPSFILGDLTPETNYCFSVRSIYGSGAVQNVSRRTFLCVKTLPKPEQLSFKPTLWVDNDGIEAKRDGITNYSKTVAAALSMATPGAVIGILPGVYPAINIEKSSVSVVAMVNKTTMVNPMKDPANSIWPVIVETTTSLNGISVQRGNDNINIHGFFVRKSGSNGIHVMGHINANKIDDICENISITGNRIENVTMDGIKANQCNALRIEGNYVNNFSLVSLNGGDQEHGIDFVAVANTDVIGNKILVGGVGMTVKGGSIAIKIEGNEFRGPFRWIPLSAGEPTNQKFGYISSWSTEDPYQAKNILVNDNNFVTLSKQSNMILWGCQNCSVRDNTYVSDRMGVKTDAYGKTLNICLSTPFNVQNTTGVPVKEIHFDHCPETIPAATKVFKNGYYDFK